MNIGIDYDGTWAADPELFKIFSYCALARGHKVYIVTGRNKKDELFGIPNWMEIYYTDGKMKEAYMDRKGIKINVWIDDNPGVIQPQRMLNEDTL